MNRRENRALVQRYHGLNPVPLEDLQQESDDSATPGEGVSAACVSPAEIEKDASAGW